MKIARVTGNVVSTINHPFFDEKRLLICGLVAPDGTRTPGYLIAVDTVDAGPGDTVILLDEGNGGRQIFGIDTGPIRTVVVGIVDEITE